MSVDPRLDRLRLLDTGDGRVLDMAGVTWLDPVHLVFAAAAAQRAAADDVPFALINLDGELAGYAARMRLGAVLDNYGARHQLPSARERDRRDSLHEVQAIASGQDVRRMAELIFDRVAPLDQATASALHTSVAEVGANVCEHSGVGSGFIAAQTVEGQDRLRFAIADAGVGMLGTLGPVGASDAQTAIAMALSGASSTGLAGHGKGLPSTLDAVSGVGGRIVLASGDAVTNATRSGRTHASLTRPFPGTLFEAQVPAARARHRALGSV